MEDLDSFASTRLANRIELDRKAVEAAEKAGVLDIDEPRTRTRYVDGQVLGADGFRRDHASFDRRQRDLSTLVARGVVAGLEVRQAMVLDEFNVETDVPDPTRLLIERGHGVTRTGETIVVLDRIDIDLTQLPIFQQLDATFALDRRPREPARTQSGVFALALRPIRYTANPIAPYPKEITGERRLEDGDIVDATAVTLVPIASESSLDGVDAGPAALARRVFADGLDPLPETDALPIAVVALARGQIAWIDMHVARREALADPSHGFGAGHRSVLEAHLRHFDSRMTAIVARRIADGLGTRFAATDYFEVLPPAGPLPTSAVSIAGDRLLQWFFPSTMEADLALVPIDELPELFEEALTLGPLELTQGAKIAESSPMMIVLAVPRADFPTVANAMGGVLRRPIGPRLGSYAYLRPIDALMPRFQRPAPVGEGPTAPVLVPWENALASVQRLYFVRQRRRARTPFALARYGPLPEEQRPSGTLSQVIFDRIDAAGEIERFDRMLATAGADALERLEVLFSLPVFADPLFINGVISELSSRTRRRLLEPGTITVGGAAVSIAGIPAGAPAPLRVRPLRFEEVDAVAGRYDGDAALGSGMLALRVFEPTLANFDIRLVIAQSLRLPELDRRIRDTATANHDALAESLLLLSEQNDVNGIRDLVGYIRPEPPPLELPRLSNGTPSVGFSQAVATGQSGLFALLWQQADDAVRVLLDNLLTHPLAHQPLAWVPLLTALCRVAWHIDMREPDDVRVLIESMYRWPFTPSQLFRVPALSLDPRIELTATHPLLAGILTRIENAGAQLSALSFDVSQTTQHLEAAGFPGPGMEPVEAYRILGCAFNDLTPIILTAAVRQFLAADFPNYVAALTKAVAAADVNQLQAIRAEWEAKF